MKLALVFGVIVVVVGFAAISAWRRSRSIMSTPFRLEGVSIYEFISKNLISATGDLSESAGDLPDEQKRSKPGGLRWAPGGLDGVFGHHGGGEQAAQKATRVASLVKQIAQTGSGDAQSELYTLLLEDSLLDCLDAAIEQMAKLRIPVTPELRQFARTVAMRSPDRGPVKFAISLLGIIRDPQDVEVISLLGKHEEFTLYAAVALTNALADPEPALFDLAQHVHGWGRIHTVERLAKTKNPVIKRWLLLKGYDNSVMHEYLACICAQAGELQVALAAESVDNELLNATTDLLRALIAGGPALDINDYEYAGSVATDYLRHIERGSLELSRFVVVQSLADYLRGSSWDTAAREKNGWTEPLRKAVVGTAENYLSRREWADLAQKGLTSSDWKTFNEADAVARKLGIDTWPVHWQRVQADPADAARWFPVMAQANADRINGIVQLAESTLPLKEIASGPTQSLGLGPEFKAHSVLDTILQSLGPYSGKGKALVLAGLRSPVVRNRNMAINAIAAWNAIDRDAEIVAALRRASAEESDPDAKVRIELVLEGKPVK